MFAMKENAMWNFAKTAFEKANTAAVAPLKGFKSLDIFSHVFNPNSRSVRSRSSDRSQSVPQSSLGLNIPPPRQFASTIHRNHTSSSQIEPHHGSPQCVLPLVTPEGRIAISVSYLVSPVMAGQFDTVPEEEDGECELPDGTYNAISKLLDETEIELPKDSFADLATPLPSNLSLDTAFSSLRILDPARRSPSSLSSRASSVLNTPISLLPFSDYTIFDAPDEYFLSRQPATEILIADGGKGKSKEDYVYDPLEEEEHEKMNRERRWALRENYLVGVCDAIGEGPSRIPICFGSRYN
ncbi:hypothetical protein M422DRAFT_66702 [Sphaerobolus stellatus SS14]|uniref:Uncharacterized protein n=1 Tax=Sphaerobolus stellatus (strain SS14) TaxID=990650 RepID=A0A0C9W3K9_SPHS4|nr:hypothetical protein M422DRAFT_780324 [Sphaerobolus stellatus SS14]KIJ46612.1 hypothetical protein M422DRAFT_66702 [Sphaerobolus stellatus SS14]